MRAEPARASAGEAVGEDASMIIDLYGGDAELALAVALEEIAHLQAQLELAAQAVSAGYTRGWRPVEKPSHNAAIHT
jgi:hypothetical protein